MKKLLKVFSIICVIMLIVMAMAGCFGTDYRDRILEQRVEFYNISEEGVAETIDENEQIHLIFPFAAKDQVESKLQIKGRVFGMQLTFHSNCGYEGRNIAIYLGRDHKDNYITEKIEDAEVRTKLMEAIYVDNILPEDDTRIAPYERVGNGTDAYNHSKDGSLALKVTVDLAKLAQVENFGAMAKDDCEYFEIEFYLATDMAFGTRTGAEKSLKCSYKYSEGKFIEYCAPVALEINEESVKTFEVGTELEAIKEQLKVFVVYNDYNKTKIELTADKYTLTCEEYNKDVAGEYALILELNEKNTVVNGLKVTLSVAEEPEPPQQ